MRAASTAFRALLCFLVVLALVGTGTAARAQSTRAEAEAILVRAEQDDDALAFARALAGYDEGRQRDPGSPRAPRAEARAAILRAHAEGDFAPFAELERVRRDPALASSPQAVDELVQHAEAFPPGLVRLEVRVLAAEAYAHRFARPAEAERLLERVIGDPLADRITTQKAARDLVTLRVERGDLGAAEAAVQLAGDRADPTLGREVRRLARRRFMHLTAIALLLGMGVLAARRTMTAGRRRAARGALARTWKLIVGYALYVAIGGAVLASGYEQGTSRPFLWLGIVLVPLLLVARAWGAAGQAGAAARVGRASLCAAGALGAAFLVLERIDAAFLEGMGL
ncbi:MAG TPA: hypothetical protein VLT33_02450 [Labilithrix sp.]|nr:hypothetical protein [Labilithrix sp.]